ncbi:hypothetical protein [Nonomuraea sp. NPDC049709]|uniref:hypothetical protein n=1 Tax=Nonomuraea sp. NPDC049709 TaxID=3154736 RepID=UPI003414F548
MTSLENLLSGGGENHADLPRRTAQRAVVLIGEDDDDRLRTLRCVKDAYNVRSIIAHGSDPHPRKLSAAATQVRSILRRALVAAIVLGEKELGPLCDEALLPQGTLREKSTTRSQNSTRSSMRLNSLKERDRQLWRGEPTLTRR